MSPHHTYLFIAFEDCDLEVYRAPFFRHLTIKRVHPFESKQFPLLKWEEVQDKQQLTQALSNEAPREWKEKRKHA